METRVAVISIIVEQEDAIEELNILLHDCRQNGHTIPRKRNQHHKHCH